MIIDLEPSDLELARSRQRQYRMDSPVAYAYDDPRAEAHQSEGFTTTEYAETTLYSLAFEATVARLLGLDPKDTEDCAADLPNGVEVMVRSARHYGGGGPYVVERRGEFHPTLTGFVVPGREAVEPRFFITPDMVPWLVLRCSYEKSWGKVRHLVTPESASSCGASTETWPRLACAVGVAPPALPFAPRAARRPLGLGDLISAVGGAADPDGPSISGDGGK